MSRAQQKVFKRIILYNKILPEDKLNALLKEIPDPEAAIERLVEDGVLHAKTAHKLSETYKKILEKAILESLEADAEQDGEGSATSTAETAPAASSAGTMATSASLPQEIGDGGPELILSLLKFARETGASDLHIKPDMPPVVRVAATLRPVDMPNLTPEVCERSLLSILTEDQREVFQETSDFDFCFDAGEELGRFRTNYMCEHRGVDGVFRPIASHPPQFEQLGLPDTVKKFTDERVGIVLVTGPKGCGKTTTLAAMIDLINSSRKEHIITVEDPIEFVQMCKEGHVNQRQVGPHTRSFSNALRSALREAPDVIMVGEMRDLETTSLAITAAETGHLVLATLHTPDAIRTIGRVLDVFPPKEQGQIRAMISESLRGICSQLLVPSVEGDSMVLVYEVLVNTPAIGHLIREERVHQIRGIMQAGKKQGMVLMDETLVRLVAENKISSEIALAHAEDVKFVEKEISAA